MRLLLESVPLEHKQEAALRSMKTIPVETGRGAPMRVAGKCHRFHAPLRLISVRPGERVPRRSDGETGKR